MKHLRLIAFVIFNNAANCQITDSLSLDFCIDNAIKNYPLSRQTDLLADMKDYKISNIRKAFLPQFFINGQASYQSDVTYLPINIPALNIPVVDKDSYKFTFDVNQLLYDGGLNKSLEYIESITFSVDRQNIETELYKLKERINQLYFNILLLNENERQVILVQEDIRSKLRKIESAIRNGVSIQSSYDILQAELKKTDIQSAEIKYSVTANIQMLRDLTGLTITDTVRLVLPQLIIQKKYENERPEMYQFSLQEEKTENMKKMVSAGTLPKLSCFGQLGYGKPGLNMLSNDFDRFYLVGAKLTWNPWNWKKSRNEIMILDLQKEIINNQSEVFEENLKLNVDKELAEIDKYEKLINIDEENVALREKVLKTSSSQLENGMITTSDYITDMNNLSQARLNLYIHKIQLVRSKINLLNLTGKQ
jgi:outer membrane protein TolC